MSKYKTALFIGRFQPFHYGHLFAIKYALEYSDFLYIGLGSSNRSHERRNPFTAAERILMIKSALEKENIDQKKWMIIPIPDVKAHYLWTKVVRMLVPKFEVVFSNDPLTLTLFSEESFPVIEVPLTERDKFIATEIRNRILEGQPWEHLVPEPVIKIIKEINGEERIKKLGK
ncbi:MAG: nicotinamide-nucleotide adenylyltransferase [Nitrososphaeria archaeon]